MHVDSPIPPPATNYKRRTAPKTPQENFATLDHAGGFITTFNDHRCRCSPKKTVH